MSSSEPVIIGAEQHQSASTNENTVKDEGKGEVDGEHITGKVAEADSTASFILNKTQNTAGGKRSVASYFLKKKDTKLIEGGKGKADEGRGVCASITHPS
jgi:hypothetical protein